MNRQFSLSSFSKVNNASDFLNADTSLFGLQLINQKLLVDDECSLQNDSQQSTFTLNSIHNNTSNVQTIVQSIVKLLNSEEQQSNFDQHCFGNSINFNSSNFQDRFEQLPNMDKVTTTPKRSNSLNSNSSSASYENFDNLNESLLNNLQDKTHELNQSGIGEELLVLNYDELSNKLSHNLLNLNKESIICPFSNSNYSPSRLSQPIGVAIMALFMLNNQTDENEFSKYL